MRSRPSRPVKKASGRKEVSPGARKCLSRRMKARWAAKEAEVSTLTVRYRTALRECSSLNVRADFKSPQTYAARSMLNASRDSCR